MVATEIFFKHKNGLKSYPESKIFWEHMQGLKSDDLFMRYQRK